MRKRFIKGISFLLLWAIFLSFTTVCNAGNTSAKEEAVYLFKDGVLKGAEIHTDYPGESDEGSPFFLSGTGVLLLQKGTSVSVNVEVEKAGLYDIIVCYAQPFDHKKVQYLNINGTNQGEVNFARSLEWKEIPAGIVRLDKGINNIEFESYWGYTFFKYLIVKPA